jgi:hypothetical protein
MPLPSSFLLLAFFLASVYNCEKNKKLIQLPDTFETGAVDGVPHITSHPKGNATLLNATEVPADLLKPLTDPSVSTAGGVNIAWSSEVLLTAKMSAI